MWFSTSTVTGEGNLVDCTVDFKASAQNQHIFPSSHIPLAIIYHMTMPKYKAGGNYISVMYPKGGENGNNCDLPSGLSF